MENRIINRVKGNISDKEFEGLFADYVDIPWYDSGKRIQRLVTKKGINIGVRLDSHGETRGLLQGDVLAVIDGEGIVVNIVEEKCIAVKMNDLRTVAKVCYEIGNRHAPLFYSEDESELILPFDQPMLEMLKKLEVQVQVRTMKIHRDKSISSMSAGHNEHSHEHEHQHTHSHEHGQGNQHTHSHEHGQGNQHTHSHETEHRHDVVCNHGTRI